jgi:hypothetical protein
VEERRTIVIVTVELENQIYCGCFAIRDEMLDSISSPFGTKFPASKGGA